MKWKVFLLAAVVMAALAASSARAEESVTVAGDSLMVSTGEGRVVVDVPFVHVEVGNDGSVCDGECLREHRGDVYVQTEHTGFVDSALGDWGASGGPLIMYLPLDLSALDPIAEDRGLPLDNDIILFGGMGGPIRENFQWGLMGFGGGTDEDKYIDGDQKSASIALGGGGFFMGVNQPVVAHSGLSAGAMVGLGGMWLGARGCEVDDDKSWHAFDGFLMADPYVGVYTGPGNFLHAELDLGYLWFKTDTDDSEFYNSRGEKMVDGEISGGPHLSLKVLFGHWPHK